MELNDAAQIFTETADTLAFRTGLDQLLRAHTPSLNDQDEADLINRVYDWSPDFDGKSDVADFALRTCSCGTRIDGFYEYIDHLRDQAGIRPALGSLPGVQEGDVPNG